MKIRWVGAETFMRTDRQTGMTKAIVVFRNFTNVLEKAAKH
jgi:hypothetical protein